MQVEAGYVKWLAHVFVTGGLANYGNEELKIVARILMAARDYISALYGSTDGNAAKSLPTEVVSAYMKLLTGGLFSKAPAGSDAPTATRKRPVTKLSAKRAVTCQPKT